MKIKFISIILIFLFTQKNIAIDFDDFDYEHDHNDYFSEERFDHKEKIPLRDKILSRDQENYNNADLLDEWGNAWENHPNKNYYPEDFEYNVYSGKYWLAKNTDNNKIGFFNKPLSYGDESEAKRHVDYLNKLGQSWDNEHLKNNTTYDDPNIEHNSSDYLYENKSNSFFAKDYKNKINSIYLNRLAKSWEDEYPNDYEHNNNDYKYAWNQELYPNYVLAKRDGAGTDKISRNLNEWYKAWDSKK